jgi:hypothetical protein
MAEILERLDYDANQLSANDLHDLEIVEAVTV